MPDPTSCCALGDAPNSYCDRCDVLVGLDGLRVVDAVRAQVGALTVTVESETVWSGCYRCGVLGHAHGRIGVRLIDPPSGGCPVTIVWCTRRWVCPEPVCPVGSFVEQDETAAAPRGG